MHRKKVKTALAKRRKGRRRPTPLPDLDWNSSGTLDFLKGKDYHAPSKLWQCNDLEDVVRLVKRNNRDLQNKAKKAVARKPMPEALMAGLNTMFTQPGFAGDINAIDVSLSEVVLRQTCSQLVAATRSEDIEIALVTLIDGRLETSDHQTMLDIAGMQKLFRPILSKMADNFIAFGEMALFNSDTHANGGRIVSLHSHAVIWGPGAINRARKVQGQMRSRLTRNFTNAEPINVKMVDADPINLARLLGYLVKPPHKCPTFYRSKDGTRANIHHSPKGDRYVRYLRLAQLRSLLRWDDVLYGGGEGATIRKQVLAIQKAMAAAQTPGVPRLVHRDALLHWWSDFYVAANLTRFKLPFIKTRA